MSTIWHSFFMSKTCFFLSKLNTVPDVIAGMKTTLEVLSRLLVRGFVPPECVYEAF